MKQGASKGKVVRSWGTQQTRSQGNARMRWSKWGWGNISSSSSHCEIPIPCNHDRETGEPRGMGNIHISLLQHIHVWMSVCACVYSYGAGIQSSWHCVYMHNMYWRFVYKYIFVGMCINIYRLPVLRWHMSRLNKIRDRAYKICGSLLSLAMPNYFILNLSPSLGRRKNIGWAGT